ncbi:MAG: phosphonate C-P lyase system protein PhnG [Spirulina sp. SIO3F2]|nr:phosphonate C-P lyase system protein PhnG [Spirulina sp. SIO3F2]
MVNASTQPRAIWMATLAKANLSQLETQVAKLGTLPDYHFLRSPEIGLAMVRGRAEGTDEPFNLGEMTITRCVVQLALGDALISGFGYVAGRSHRHAELAALCDALLQHPDWQSQIQSQVIDPLQQAAQAERATQAAEVESTRVNFFTMLRGEG